MKKLFFVFIAISLFCCFQIQAAISPLPWWAGKLDPAKDVIVNLWVETNRSTYDNNEVILFEVSFSDPDGLNGQICLITTDNKISTCQILPSYIIGQTGTQAEFPVLERVPGKYQFRAKFLSGGKIVTSNEVEITINPVSSAPPSVGSIKTENAVIDGYEFWWTRTYTADGVWAKPMPLGEPHRVFMAPASDKNPTTWGMTKKGKVSTTWSSLKLKGDPK